jgi:hypothetical protein
VFYFSCNGRLFVLLTDSDEGVIPVAQSIRGSDCESEGTVFLLGILSLGQLSDFDLNL